MIVATSGHVDHGKTRLVHALTGIETDRLEEEKVRGLTIDLGFAYMHNGSKSIGFIDVPGHIKFISNMLAGVAAIDFGMLVIAADDGPMPQTCEHLAILDLLGLNRGCVVMTKIDRVDEDRMLNVTQEIRQLVANTSLGEAPIYPVSSATGQGIDQLLGNLWSESDSIITKQADGNFRLAIDRSFSVKGSGNVVTGSVFSGDVNVGDEIYLLPHNRSVRVRGIHRQNQNSDSGSAGDRCAINITGDIDRDLISRGNWLSSVADLPFSDRIDVQIILLGSEANPLYHWTPVHVHSAAQHVTGRVATLESKSITPGDKQLAQLVLSEPIHVYYGDQLIIRDQSASRTLGGGKVIDPYSPKRGRAKQDRSQMLSAMLTSDFRERITQMVRVAVSGVDTKRLKSCFNITDFSTDEFGVTDGSGILFSSDAVDSAKKDILEMMQDWHKTHPQETGIPEQQLISLLDPGVDIIKCAVQILLQTQKILQIGNKLKLPAHNIELAGPEMALWNKVKPLLQNDLLKPPVLHDLAKAVNLPPGAVEKLLGNCIKFGLVVRPVKNRFFLPPAVQSLKEIAIDLANSSEDNKFTVIEFRDKAGIGRNLSIEILEYFDRIGFTRRIDDFRIVQDTTR